MAERYIIFVMMFLLLPFHSLAAVAKHGCADKCGDVSIPYPFGMGTNCAADDWFDILCKQQNTSFKPFLKKHNLEVLDIQQPSVSDSPIVGIVQLNSPIFCNWRNAPPVNLTGSPFAFPGIGSYRKPKPGKLGSVVYYNGGHDFADCKLQWMEYGLSNSSAEAVGLIQRSTKMDSDFLCFSFKNTVQCVCHQGYNGTAYLPGSCEDINECELKYTCRGGDHCFNEIGSYTCWESGFSKVVKFSIAVLVCLGVLVFFILGLCLYKVIQKRVQIKRKKQFYKQNGGLLLEQLGAQTTRVFTCKDLETATDNFNEGRILGRGGQGAVFKGMLADGRVVAVKKSQIEREERLITQFINEIVILSQVNHRNIVRLLGCCLEKEVPLLVYEYVQNGTLSHYLHNPDEVVSWEERLRIATQVARALSHLHNTASGPIWHRDIKSDNILLDNTCTAKVADFGTSRLMSFNQTHFTTLVQGTFGYMDPEYMQSGRYTDKSDVFSFGVLLVELLTGRKAVYTDTVDNQRKSLALKFLEAMGDGRLSDLVDPLAVNHDFMPFAVLARSCLDMTGSSRPSMQVVSAELERISNSEDGAGVGYEAGVGAESGEIHPVFE